ncbi:hypothetical protein DFS34DRAFT_624378 [Phlyctochytrium arcticum]|nr:hypothetical protein DFS34DRAFT_624378 [Phlyctochytrium arcticum]
MAGWLGKWVAVRRNSDMKPLLPVIQTRPDYSVDKDLLEPSSARIVASPESHSVRTPDDVFREQKQRNSLSRRTCVLVGVVISVLGVIILGGFLYRLQTSSTDSGSSPDISSDPSLLPTSSSAAPSSSSSRSPYTVSLNPMAQPQFNVSVPLSFAVTDAQTHTAVTYTEFARQASERMLHVALVSPGAMAFGHIHPEDFGNTGLDVRFRFPAVGNWALGFNFKGGAAIEHIRIGEESLTTGGVVELGSPQHQSIGQSLQAHGDAYRDPILFDSESSRVNGKYQLVLSSSPDDNSANAIPTIKSNTCTQLYVSVFDLATNVRIKDLRPYLDAAAHIVYIKADQTQVKHSHGTFFSGTSPSSNLCSGAQKPSEHTIGTRGTGSQVTFVAQLDPGMWTAVVQMGRGEQEMIVGRFVIQVD